MSTCSYYPPLSRPFMDQSVAKQTLQQLAKREDLGNKVCCDCGNPNPQWASLSFAILICLQCAGTHRGFGVHISFVRSISMDTWQEEQVKRMQLGGNSPFKDFMRSYPGDKGGYSESLSSYDTYHCWAATQYREKLDAQLAGKEWSFSDPPASTSAPDRPSSAQGLRKARALGRGSTLSSSSPSPASFSDSPRTQSPIMSFDQKAANESYFASMGQANSSRPEHLPPSQGGKYQGFGSTPTPDVHPSYGLSSAAAPTLSDLQENPMAALSKGWSLFSSAVVGATKVVNENVIQPSRDRVMDPEFQANVKGYLTEAQKRATDVGSTANQWSKRQLGVDVATNVGGAVSWGKDRVSGGPQRRGYGQVAMDTDGETSALYNNDDQDFFGQYDPPQKARTSNSSGSLSQKDGKKNDWEDDEWKDF